MIPDAPLTLGPATGTRPGLSDPYSQVFRQPFAFVYRAGAAQARDYAAFLVSYWAAIGNGQAFALPSDALRPEVEAAYNPIFVGLEDAAPTLEWSETPDFPFQWGPGGVTVGDVTRSNAGLMLVVPRGIGGDDAGEGDGDGARLSAILYATPGSEHLLYRPIPFSSCGGTPGYLVWTEEGGAVAGIFDADWRWDPAIARESSRASRRALRYPHVVSVSVAQILRQAALRAPQRVAVVEVGPQGRCEVLASALDERARRGAAALRAWGLLPGQRVGLMGANSADFIAAWFAITYAGGVVVPLPVRSAPREVAVRLAHAGAHCLLADPPSRQIIAHAPWQDPPPRVVALETLAPPSSASGAPAALPFPAEPAADGAAMILYTSGTAGHPKAAVISHASLVAHTAGLVHHTLRLTRHDVVLGVLPLTHSFGWRMAALAPLYAEATVVLPTARDGRFHAADTRTLMRREGVTWLPAVPTMFAAWARLGPAPPDDGEPPSKLRWCLSAGAPLAEDVRVRAEAALRPGGVEIRQGYGMTEATFATIDGPRAPQHPGTVGRPAWGVEVRVVDSQDVDVPADGETLGEILIRGTNVMLGYLDDPAATAACVRDGWVHSGDVGRLSPDGWLTVVDRTRDIILRGGFTVYPSEVEHALCEHPDVTEAAVVGRPDPYYGEEIVAFVVISEARADPAPLTRDALLTFARARLGADKVPREVVFVARLPQGASGKVLKRVLVAQLTGPSPTAPP